MCRNGAQGKGKKGHSSAHQDEWYNHKVTVTITCTPHLLFQTEGHARDRHSALLPSVNISVKDRSTKTVHRVGAIKENEEGFSLKCSWPPPANSELLWSESKGKSCGHLGKTLPGPSMLSSQESHIPVWKYLKEKRSSPVSQL